MRQISKQTIDIITLWESEDLDTNVAEITEFKPWHIGWEKSLTNIWGKNSMYVLLVIWKINYFSFRKWSLFSIAKWHLTSEIGYKIAHEILQWFHITIAKSNTSDETINTNEIAKYPFLCHSSFFFKHTHTYSHFNIYNLGTTYNTEKY